MHNTRDEKSKMARLLQVVVIILAPAAPLLWEAGKDWHTEIETREARKAD
jgi:hypothetical protein